MALKVRGRGGGGLDGPEGAGEGGGGLRWP